MVFHYRFWEDEKMYSVYFDDEKPDTIRIFDGEKQKRLKVRNEYGWAIKGHNAFVGCNGGAAKLFEWLCDCAKENFCTCYIDALLRDFNNNKSKKWIAA